MLLDFGKDDISKLVIDDYIKLLELIDNHKYGKTKGILCKSFFDFLYCFDYLNDPLGFENYILKNKRRSDFEKNKTKLLSNTTMQKIHKIALTTEQIFKIQEYVQLNNDDILFLKMSFCWFLLFETNFTVNQIKNIKGTSFNGKSINIGNRQFNIPEKYYPLFNKLKLLPGKDGLNLHENIARLGNYLGYANLIPGSIIQAKHQNTIICSNCGRTHSTIATNWKSVNNRMICYICADELKKNYNVIDIINYHIIVINNDDKVKLECITSTFDELKTKIQSKTDYLKLQEFQIQLGNLGEAYIYDIEVSRLLNTPYATKVDRSKAANPENGYDILSYDDIDGHKIYIEVKTTINKHDCFYMTEHERRIMESFIQKKMDYRIYWVRNILDDVKDNISYITFNKDNINKLNFIEHNWKVYTST